MLILVKTTNKYWTGDLQCETLKLKVWHLWKKRVVCRVAQSGKCVVKVFFLNFYFKNVLLKTGDGIKQCFLKQLPSNQHCKNC